MSRNSHIAFRRAILTEVEPESLPGDGSKSFDIERQLPGNPTSCNHRLAVPSDTTFLGGIDKALELAISCLAGLATVRTKRRSRR